VIAIILETIFAFVTLQAISNNTYFYGKIIKILKIHKTVFTILIKVKQEKSKKLFLFEK
jgi:hypothetical protein